MYWLTATSESVPEHPVGSIYCSGSSVSVVTSSKPISPLRVKHGAVLKRRATEEELEDVPWIFSELRKQFRVPLTSNMEFNDLLGMEKAYTDCTDVGPLIHNL